MNGFDTINTYLSIYNTIARVWSYVANENHFGIRAAIDRYKRDFTITEIDKELLSNLFNGDFYEGFKNSILINENQDYKQYLNLRIILYKNGYSIGKDNSIARSIPRFTSDSNLELTLYLNYDLFALNINASNDNLYQDAINKICNYIYLLFIQISEIVSQKSYEQASNNETIEFAKILSLLFIYGILSLQLEDVLKILSIDKILIFKDLKEFNNLFNNLKSYLIEKTPEIVISRNEFRAIMSQFEYVVVLGNLKSKFTEE